MGVKAKSYTQRPAGFDAQVLACLPKLNRMASRLTYRDNREDLVNSTVERALRLWSQRGSYKIDVWLIYMMRAVAYEERQKLGDPSLSLDDIAMKYRGHQLQETADQEHVADASLIMRAVEAGPHADVMTLIAQGFTTDEVGKQLGVSKQRVHQKVTAFRRAHSDLSTKEEFA